MKFNIANKRLNEDRSYRWNWANTKLDMNDICLRDINSRILDIPCISHELSITGYGMLGYTSINYNLIEFIRQILVNSNIGKKIWVEWITGSIGEADMIKQNIAKDDERVTEWSIGEIGSYFFGFFSKA